MKKLNFEKHRIVVVCGQAYSGKTTIANAIAKLSDSKVIEIGEVVRQITNREKRILDASLDTAICDELQILLHKPHLSWVISGVRQASILQFLQWLLPSESIYYIWLDVDIESLEERFKTRTDNRKESFNSFVELAAHEEAEFTLSECRKFIEGVSNGKILKL